MQRLVHPVLIVLDYKEVSGRVHLVLSLEEWLPLLKDEHSD